MASKGPPPKAAILSPHDGIARLSRCVSKGEVLLTDSSADEQDFRNWIAVTNQAVDEALGEEHGLTSAARDAGRQRTVVTSENLLDDLRIRVRKEVKALAPCLEYLQEQVDKLSQAPTDVRRVKPSRPSYDSALICTNGHLINDSYNLEPQHNKKRCPQCGAATICNCPGCAHEVQGRYYGDGVTRGLYRPPNNCHECGAPYPWTEARLRAISELLAMSDLSPADQAALRDSVPALTGETPSTPVAVRKWKGAGKALELVGDVLKEVVSEAVKRQLFGP